MRLVFMGTPEFATEFLQHLLAGSHSVVAVVTQPDKQSGRGMALHAPPVKELALRCNIPVLQPSSVKEPGFVDDLMKFEADLFVVVAFSILPERVLAAARFGAVNVHGSLLPRYRGAAPVQWAIANNESKTGVTVFLLDAKMDHGPVLEQRVVEISQDDTTESLLKKMVVPGCEALDCAFEKLLSGTFERVEQNHLEASPAPKLKKEDGVIDWRQSAQAIHKKICAFTPWPGGFTGLNGNRVYLRKTEVALGNDKNLDCGEIFLKKDSVLVGTGDGLLSVLEIQAEGKKRMNPVDFFRGYKCEKPKFN